jgi:hypothetical protein
MVATVMFLTGSMTIHVLTVFGFIAFGLVFMGMMGVLPVEVSHPSGKKGAEPKMASTRANARQTAARVGGAVASYFDPKKVQVHKHGHP